MATFAEPNLVTDGLVFHLDAANSRCYSGTGLTVSGLVGGIGGTSTAGVAFSSSNNGSFSFNNSTDHINFGNPSALQGLQLNMTLCCWFNQRNNRQYATLYSDYSEVINSKLVSMMRVDNGSLKYFTTYLSGGYQNISPMTVTNNVWYYAAVSVSGSVAFPTAIFFVNGTFYSYNLQTLSASPFTGNNHCVGGNFHIAEYFDGNIGQVKIYNRALTAQEIQQNFDATKGRYGY